MKNIDFIKYFFSSILSLSMATSINLRALETNPPLSSQPVKINFGNPYSNSSTLLVVDGSYILNGMFSVFLICLGVLDKFEQGHFGGLWINLNAGAYFEPTKGPNWWNYYFNPIAIIPNRAWIPHVIPQNELYKIGFNSLFYLSKQRGHELIQKYISIHPFIVEEVEDFTRKYFDKSHILACIIEEQIKRF